MGPNLAADHKDLAIGKQTFAKLSTIFREQAGPKQRMPGGAIAPPGIRVACRETTGCVCR
jgi:hypothetical protein